MTKDYDDKLRKQVATGRSIAHYGMGIFWILLGLAFLFRKSLKLAIEKYPPDYVDIVIGVLFVVYGSWRIYRGYKKNYFRE